MIRNEEKVFWYPYWGAFYYMTYGRLVLKIDMSYSTADADVVNPSKDPCQSDAPIFKCSGYTDANCIKHVIYNVGNGYNSANTFIDHVWVFKFMYFAMQGSNSNYIYKVSGNPRTNTLAVNAYITSYAAGTSILSLVNLEQFGFYVTLLNGGT